MCNQITTANTCADFPRKRLYCAVTGTHNRIDKSLSTDWRADAAMVAFGGTPGDSLVQLESPSGGQVFGHMTNSLRFIFI